MAQARAKKSPKSSARKAVKKVKRVAAPETNESESALGFEAEYERFLPEAEALKPSDVVPMSVDLELALYNAQAGVSWVGDHAKRIAALPGMDPNALLDLPNLVGATIFADQRVDRGPSSGETGKLMQEGRELRALLMSAAEMLVLAGLMPDNEVARIRKGRGAMDAASDCVALAALFRKYASARAKTAVTAAQISRAGEVGTNLLGLLKPARGKSSTDKDRRAALDLRNRFWTLTVRRHADVWRCAGFLFAGDADQYVPSLQAHRATKRGPAKPKEPLQA